MASEAAPQTDTNGFAAALRGWRQRRRVSQLELALRAGTTQRHISFVESGRSVPGRAMVVRLAEALEVPLRERNALLLTAGFAPVYERTSYDDPKLGPVRFALERVLTGHLPYPAILADRRGDLVSANSAFWLLIEGVAPALLTAPISIPRLLLHPMGLAPRIINLDEWAWHVVDALQRNAARTPDDYLAALAVELTTYVSDPRRVVAPHHVGFAVPLRLRSNDGELRLLTTLTHFGTAIDVTIAELILEAFLPADDATAAILSHRSGVRIPGRIDEVRTSPSY